MSELNDGFAPYSPDSPEPPLRAMQRAGEAEPDGQAGQVFESAAETAEEAQQLGTQASRELQDAQAQASALGAEVRAQAQPVGAVVEADAVSADTTGLDVAGEIQHTSLYEPIPSSDRTESFHAARMGDTASMPTGLQGQVTAASAGDAARLGATAAPAASGFTPAAAAPGAVPARAQSSAYDSGYASQGFATAGGAVSGGGAVNGAASAYARDYRSAGAQPSAAPAETGGYTAAAQRATAPEPKQKTPASAGKTFLCGFLGAALACGLCLGGYALANRGSAGSPAAASTALIGTTDQSVINAVDEGQTLAEAVAAKALPSVVAIYNYQKQASSYGYGFGYGYGLGNQDEDSLVATGMGSGVVISDEGYIVTNYHVVENASKLTVSVDGVERDATYVGGDSSSDIAVVKVDDTEGLVAADIGDSDSLRIGEWVMTVGAPLGLEQSVATGVVSATNRSTIMDSSSSDSSDLYSYFYGNTTPEYTYYPNMIQTDAVINPGNSGGALVDADGKLIGINAMISSYSGDYAGVGFAIPVNYAIQIAQSVIEGKEVTHAMIGVSLSQVNSQIAQRYNLSSDTGAYISAITPDTGAAESDLQVGDIITKVGGKSVTSPTDVTLEVRAHKVGDTVTLTVNRDGETLDIDVTLTSDENMTPTVDENAQSQEGEGDGQDQGQGWGNGRGNGRGNGEGYSIEDLERLFELLGR